MGAPRKYPPINAQADIEMLACKGWSTIGLAKHFGVSRPTISKWLEENERLGDAYEQGRDSYRQTLEEQIIAMTLSGRNPAGLIYLLKAKFKMYDVPNNKAEISVDVKVAPVLVVKDMGTDEQWAAKALEQQRKLTANAGSIDMPLVVAPSIQPVPLIDAALLYAPPAMPFHEAPSWKQNS